MSAHKVSSLKILLLVVVLGSCTSLTSGVTRGALTSGSLNTSALSSPAASGLASSIDGLEQQVSPFSGLLSLRVPVYRIGDRVGYATYLSADDFASQAMPGRTFTGLPFQWERPWLARLTLTNPNMAAAPEQFLPLSYQPQGASIAFSDGRVETLFAPIPEGLPLPNAENAVPLNTQTTSGMSSWKWLAPSGEYELTTQDGTRYRFGGACFDNGDNRDGMCDARSVQDVFGNGLRVRYYGESDSDPANDTSVPRIIETYRQTDQGNETISRVYFYLRSAYNGDTPPLAEPADVLTIPARRDSVCRTLASTQDPCARILGWMPLDYHIGAIAYPGPQSTPTQIDGSWHHTRFGYATSEYAYSGYSTPRTWSQLQSIHTEGSEYRFSYGGGDLQGRTLHGATATPGPARTAGRISSVRLPHGQSIEYEWEWFRSAPFYSGQFSDRISAQGLAHWTIRDAAQREAGQSRSPSFEWHLHHIDVARGGDETTQSVEGPNGPVRLHAAIVSYPTGISTATYFHPLARVGFPASAKTGLVAEVRTFDHDIWDHDNDRLSAAVDSIQPVTKVENGHALFARGALMLQEAQRNSNFQFSWNAGSPFVINLSGERWLNPDAVGWVALPSFQVSTQYEQVPAQSWNWCAPVSVFGEAFDETTLFCAGNASAPVSACPENDALFASLAACEQVPINLNCYRLATGGTNVYCGRLPELGAPDVVCPTGTVSVPSCGASATWQGHSVVTMFREARPQAFLLETAISNNHADYDQFGNPPFQRTFAADNVTVTRPASYCGHCTLDEARGQGWECPTNFCDQDTVSAALPSDLSLAQEVRYQYVAEESSLAAEYLDRGMTSLVRSVNRCQIGTTCQGGFGLLSRTELFFDNREVPYPFSDAVGDLGTTALGRLTATREVNIENPSESPISFINYYVNQPNQPLGAPAETAATIDATRTTRTRLAYDGNPILAAQDPTRVYVIDDAGSAHLVEEGHYDTWGNEVLTRGENGETTHRCFDTRGRIIATFAPTDTFSGCENTSSASGETRYIDTVPARTITTERIRRDNVLYTLHSATFYDGFARPVHTQVERAPGELLSTSTRYAFHTGLIRSTTEPYVTAGTIGETFDYGFDQLRSETEYDAMLRPTAERLVSGTQVLSEEATRYGDASDVPWNEVHSIDNHGRRTIYRGDGLGRPVATVQPDGSEITVFYDATGAPTRLRQADGLESTSTRDSLGRTVRQTSPESGVVTATYDRLGRVVRTRLANGQDTRLEYDYRGRLLRRWSRGEVEAEYTYDVYPANTTVGHTQYPSGRLTRATFGEGQIDLGYQQEGLITQQHTRLNGLPEKRLFRRFDSSGALIAQHYQGEEHDAAIIRLNNHPTRYELSSIAFMGVEVERVFRDALGRVQQRQLRNGSNVIQQVDIGYDQFSRLRSINDPMNLGADVFGYEIRYDDPILGGSPRRDGSPSEVIWNRQGLEPAAFVYGYDQRGRLTRADFRQFQSGVWQNPSQYDLNASYSSMGQLQVLSRGTSNGSQITEFSYQSTTRRLQSSFGAVVGQFTYDASGNVRGNSVLGPAATITTSGSFQQTEAVANGLTRSEYGYDDAGQLVRITQQSWDPTCNQSERGGSSSRGPGGCYVDQDTTHIIRDPDGNEIAEYQNGVATRLSMGPPGYFVPLQHGGDPAIEPGHYFVMSDHLGSVRAVINDAAELVRADDFDPLGQPLEARSLAAPTNPAGANPQWRSFATYRNQTWSGQYQVAGARLYSPELGRFLSADPLAGLEAGNHAYAYAGNNPAANNDPSGLCTNCPVVALPTVDVVASRITPGITLPGMSGVTSTATLDLSRFTIGPSMGGSIMRGPPPSMSPAGAGILNAFFNPASAPVGPSLSPISASEIDRRQNVVRLVEAAEFRAMRRQQYTELATALLSMGRQPARLPRMGAPAVGPYRRTVFSGHGGISRADQIRSGTPLMVQVPKGTSVTVWARNGGTITNTQGRILDRGQTPSADISLGGAGRAVGFGEQSTSQSTVLGAAGPRTYLPGSYMPNYSLSPIEWHHRSGAFPIIVSRPTPLSQLLRDNMGNMTWSACCEIRR